MLVVFIIMTLVAVASIVVSVLLWTQAARARLQLQGAQNDRLALGSAASQLSMHQRQSAELTEKLQAALAEIESKNKILDNMERENEFYRDELEKRPKMTRRVYRILTLGISGTGKTALTLKWSNPLFDLGLLKGTKIERYERTVSQVANKDITTEHVFEVGDWGGEHIVDALQEAITEEIHGMLIVVDLTSPAPPGAVVRKDAKAVDTERVQKQLREFQPEVLKFFFGPKTIASCKTVVLFINKSDVLAGTPADVEHEACKHYRKLIDDLEEYKEKIDVRVLVGSATSGHSTHHLFSHFVDRILPKNAYDAQLLQRMMAENSADERANGKRK